MIKDNNKDIIQHQAIEKWLSSNKIGTIEAATGTGKNFIFLHALYSMPLDKSVKHLFLAEVTDRKLDLDKEIIKYNQIFNRDIYKDYNLIFSTYQSYYKKTNEKFGLVGADEIHFALSPQYSKFFFNNTYDAIVGLSATIDRNTQYEVNGKRFTKGELLDKIAPVCFIYTLAQAKDDGVGRQLNVYIIKQDLDSINKSIKAGSVKKPFFQTEKSAYEYWDKEHKRSWFIEDKELKELKIRITSTKRSNLLFNLPSKIEIVKELLNNIKGKSILFGNSLDSLLKVTPNTVSSRYSEDKNKAIREAFDKGNINLIGSFKKLLQGANLKELDNCILMSYYSTEKDAIQRWGRLRRNGNKVGSVFILLTNNTQEEIWLSKMLANLTDFNIIYCKNLQECLDLYKQNEEN